MKYKIKQLSEALGYHREVTDSLNNVIYRVEGSFAKIPKTFTIKDKDNNIVAIITKEFMKFYARYYVQFEHKRIEINRDDIAPIISISEGDGEWVLQGDFMNRVFKMTDATESTINIKRHLFKFYSEFDIVVNDPKDLLMGISIVMIISDLINV